MNRLVPLPFVLAPALALLTACPPTTKDCDLMAVASAQVTLLTHDGAPLPEDAWVEFSVDGGDWQPCEDLDGVFVCGWEQAGAFEVRADGWGYGLTLAAPFMVEQDVCHVEPVLLDLTLEELACTTEEVASIALTVTDPDGAAVPGVTAAWMPLGADWTAPQPCEGQGTGWICGAEVGGDIELWVDARGYESHYEVVTVDFDECHVITSEVDVVLEPVN
ncbi:MAG: hypothetical protein H6739_14165 [Alphaproteobacteria bacterium]|nr:hypothetical protein [Alphaproteobacteria bacterium]